MGRTVVLFRYLRPQTQLQTLWNEFIDISESTGPGEEIINRCLEFASRCNDAVPITPDDSGILTVLKDQICNLIDEIQEEIDNLLP
jgi:hypothetical protein